MQPFSRSSYKHKPSPHAKAHKHVQSTINHGFDRENGQRYLESEVVFRRRNATDWIRDLRTPLIVVKATPNEKGPRTLLDMAKIKSASLIRNLTPEHLEFFPWRLADMLWAEIVSQHTESLFSWQLFASQYNKEDEFASREGRYHLEIKDLPLPMTDYYSGLHSSQHDWHVALRISPKQNTIPDLVSIADISNLAVLDLSDGQMLLDMKDSTFDERIMRTWAELAVSQRAFTQLRVLMFGWQGHVSGWIFKYLNQFPMLKLVVVTDCGNMQQTNRQDWEPLAIAAGWVAYHRKRSVKMMQPLLDDKTSRIGAISALYYVPQSVEGSFDSLPGTVKTSRPLMECWLGSPRAWTHIVDEFAGTRTIWLERTGESYVVPTPAPWPAPRPVKRARERKQPPKVVSPKPDPKKKKLQGRAPKYEASKLLAEFER